MECVPEKLSPSTAQARMGHMALPALSEWDYSNSDYQNLNNPNP
jgi:hypothetical protein